jgi:GNAT superfamily N-acetyltransferase
MSDVTYRPATDSDLDAMFELWWEMQTSHTEYDALWYGPKPKEECRPLCLNRFRKFLADDTVIVLLAVLCDQPVGMLIGHIVGRPPVLTEIKVFAINNVVVTEAHRRKGVLRGMMDAVTAEVRTKGVKAIKFSVHSDNPARAAYERLGFTCHELSMGKYLE